MVDPIFVSDAVISDMEHLSQIQQPGKKWGISEVWKYSVSEKDGSLQKTDSKATQVARFIFGYLRFSGSQSHRRKLEAAFFKQHYMPGTDISSSTESESYRDNILNQLRGAFGKDQFTFMKLLQARMKKTKKLTNSEWAEEFAQALANEERRSQRTLNDDGKQFTKDRRAGRAPFDITINNKTLRSDKINEDGREIKQALGQENEDWYEAVLMLASDWTLSHCTTLRPATQMMSVVGETVDAPVSVRQESKPMDIFVAKDDSGKVKSVLVSAGEVKFNADINGKILCFSEDAPHLTVKKDETTGGFVFSGASNRDGQMRANGQGQREFVVTGEKRLPTAYRINFQKHYPQ